jgi:hypothetical protein
MRPTRRAITFNLAFLPASPEQDASKSAAKPIDAASVELDVQRSYGGRQSSVDDTCRWDR